jgi:hypothetical protein
LAVYLAGFFYACLSAFLRRLKELIKPRAAARGLRKTYGGKFTAGRNPKNAGRGRWYFLKFSRRMDAGRINAGRIARAAGSGQRAAGSGQRAAGRDTRGAAIKTRIPVWSQKAVKNQTFTKNRAARPPACLAGARAMFLSNNYRKNDMNVSRETIAYFLGTSCPNIKLRLPIF